MRVNNVYIATKYRAKCSKTILRVNSSSLHRGPVSNTVTYYNYLPVAVVVVERTGFRYVIPPNAPENETHVGFIVRTEKTIRSTSLDEVKRQILKANTVNNDELAAIRETLVHSNFSNVYDGLVIPIDTVYTLEDFQNNNQCLYCDKRDIILSLKNVDEASAHPGDIDTIHGDELITTKYDDINIEDFVLRLEIVDNHDTIGDRYSYALGEVRAIRAKKDPDRISGVYYYSVVKDFLNVSGCALKMVTIPIEEADEKFGLFKTRIDAQEAGDLKEVRKKENLELQHQIEIFKKNAELDKIQQEQLKRDRDEIIYQNQHENTVRERDWEYKRREYEHRAKMLEQELEAKKIIRDNSKDARKDIIDIIKFLPQVIIAIGAIFVVVAKFKPTK